MADLNSYQLFRLRYSLATLASGTGLEKSTISRVLNGEREPLLSTAAAIASFTSMSLDDFYRMWEGYIRPLRPLKKR
jgi:transcriptional regulator with XRE-family HTH domain